MLSSLSFENSREHAGGAREVALWICLHIFVWTLYATLSAGPIDIHHDMAEAYSWGREFQLGYYKHPPFWAWVVGAWFKIMPRADWAYYLLSMLNAALGLWAAWLIAGRLIEDRVARLTAMLLLEFVPFYHFMAFKFNANTIMLSLWAWAIYFYLRLIEERSLKDAIGLGVVAGFGLMSKYYFALLLVTFAICALIDKRRIAILTSPAPWIAMFIAAAMFAPHVWWLTQHGFAPFQYISESAQQPRLFIAWKALQFGAGCILFHTIVIAFLVAFPTGRWTTILRAFDWSASNMLRRQIIVIVLSPVLLTMLAALTSNVKVDTNFAVGIFPVVPLLLMTTPGYQFMARAHVYVARDVAIVMAILLVAAPLIAYVRFAWEIERADEPRMETARAAEAIWEKEFGKPLKIVAGGWPYGESAPFYARGDVSHFTYLSRAYAPWISDARIARDGVAVICRVGDLDCFSLARTALPGPLREATFATHKSFLGRDGRRFEFVVLMQPPASPSP